MKIKRWKTTSILSPSTQNTSTKCNIRNFLLHEHVNRTASEFMSRLSTWNFWTRTNQERTVRARTNGNDQGNQQNCKVLYGKSNQNKKPKLNLDCIRVVGLSDAYLMETTTFQPKLAISLCCWTSTALLWQQTSNDRSPNESCVNRNMCFNHSLHHQRTNNFSS